MARKIILIGGMPTAGKSTIAKALSDHLGIPWISTDQIRQIMQSVASPNEHPLLFTSEGYTAEQFLDRFSPKEMAQMEYDQAGAVWPGVRKIIRNDFTWREGFIIEGVSLIPQLIAEDFSDKPNVVPIFLSDNNEDKIREIIFKRGIRSNAENCPDNLKEKEIEWVLLFDKLIKDEVTRFGYPLIDIKKDDRDLEKILKILKKIDSPHK